MGQEPRRAAGTNRRSKAESSRESTIMPQQTERTSVPREKKIEREGIQDTRHPFGRKKEQEKGMKHTRQLLEREEAAVR
jgi:hypothetical protein